jgi:ATP synthase I chain
VATAEPEREIVRRILPLSVPAVALASVVGGLLGGADAAASAAIAVVVVFANFVFFAVSLDHGARISLTVLYAVALGGFMVRLIVFVALLLLLQQLPWFNVAAFVATFVACTVVLLSVEIKMISGRMQADLWSFESGRGVPR